MRKHQNLSSSTNPLGLFAQGVEHIIREQSEKTNRYDDYELNEMVRKEACLKNSSPKYSPFFGFHITDLVKQLVWRT
jgi:histidinol-phosphate/aromatic aminotransferase/cobyric acid decarboxylase-like protein